MLKDEIKFLCVSCEGIRSNIVPTYCGECFSDLSEDEQIKNVMSLKPHYVAFWTFSF